MTGGKTSAFKAFTKIGTVLTMMLAASACTHEQLKQETEVSAIEDTGTPDLATAPTPDVAEPVADEFAAPTPIPGDVGSTAPKAAHHAKAKASHKKHHPKKHASKKKHVKVAKHKKAKTSVATAGTVESQLPPPPPGPTEAALPAPAVPADAVLTAPLADAAGESTGHGLAISLAVLALGGLTFAGTKLRRARGSRRLVFN